MLEHVPQWLGALFRNVRAGHAKLTIVQPDIVTGNSFIALSSPAFPDGGRLPERFTADGEGLSPPLVWGAVPEGTRSMALLVEDPDAPALQPLVHALAWSIPPDDHNIAEGMMTKAAGHDLGRNSLFTQGWLPPDPPTGHGPHDYVFQLFALSEVPDMDSNVGRSELVRAMTGRVLAAGMLVGTYSRGEEKMIPTGSTVAAPTR